MANVIELDNRGLQPPEPMLRILEALDRLGPDESLVAVNDREPVFLYPMLQERSLRWTATQRPDGAYNIAIDR